MLILKYTRTQRGEQLRFFGPALGSINKLLIFGFSWMLVMAIGLMALVDDALGRPPAITTPTGIAFATAIGSGLLLRRQYSWTGLILHIYGQIATWLSIFVISLTLVLLLAERT